MEGTRHERVATVIASYAIGFTTAFILYSNVQTLTQEVFISIPEQKAAVALSQTVEEPAVAEPATPATLNYEAGRLELVANNQTKLLSFNPEVNEFNVDLDELTQGFHYGELDYSFSNDNNFVFFCERHDVEDDSCVGFVYDLAEDKIYPITKEGSAVTISAKSAETATWSEGGLAIGSSRSANPSAPWVLISDNSPLDLE